MLRGGPPGVAFAVLVAYLLSGCQTTPAGPGADGAPGAGQPPTLGILGHSFLVGFNRDVDHLGNSPEASWPSGDDATSLRALLGAPSAENLAQGGATIADLEAQAASLEEATLVVVGFGTNDACSDPPLPAADFEAALRDGVRALVGQGLTVLLLSEVDLVGLFAASRPPTAPAPDADPPAAALYAIYRACALRPGTGEMLAAYNAAIARVAEAEGAMHDGGAQSRVRWTSTLLSEVDGFHPNLAGNELLARTAHAAYRSASTGAG